MKDSSGNDRHAKVNGGKWVRLDVSDAETGWGELIPANAPPPAIAPFDADQAKNHQQAWAEFLGVPVEKEIIVGKDEDGKDVIAERWSSSRRANS